MLPGLLLALGAASAHAQTATPPAAAPNAPEATPSPAPLDLSLPQSQPQATPLGQTPPQMSNSASAPSSTTAPLPPTLSGSPQAAAAAPPTAAPPLELGAADSDEVKLVARWVYTSRDNGGLPYLLIDKANARAYSFSRGGQLQGSAPVLLGMAKGDRLLAPNTATMSVMRPQDRITPAGRFVSRLAVDSHGKELLVLDYDASISLHPVVKGKPEERRAERLASLTSADNRISFGCINAPPDFYKQKVSIPFTGTKGIVYVLPETSTATAMFNIPPVLDAAATAAQLGTATSAAAPTQSVTAPIAN
jgi:hypothetical protein